MSQFTVTAVDTIGIQPYIFGSNRLRENVGASELVRLATREWAFETIREVSNRHNIISSGKEDFDETFKIEDEVDDSAAEVIYAGGGNIVIVFRSTDKAKEFASELTRRVLLDAPGLSLVIAHSPFDWPNQPLSELVDKLINEKSGERKAGRLPSAPLLGLGVTAACQSTGLVAVRTDDGLRPKGETRVRLISRETLAKLERAEAANDHLADLFTDDLAGEFQFPFEIENLGRIKGEESYLSVVHSDGNGMGQRIKEIIKRHRGDNRRYIEAMRRFSQNLNRAASEALRLIVTKLTRSLRIAVENDLIADKIPLDRNETGAYWLPFRPLVFGGDDVTFVCNGQIGLSLAAEYLKAFEEETAKVMDEKMFSCAGIAMVKMRYPFARAYALSEELIRQAKKFARRINEGKKVSALDWHFATTGLSGSLAQIREREYMIATPDNTLEHGTLIRRPLLLTPNEKDGEERAWFERTEKLVKIFQQDDIWSQKRNKVKALREALRGGENEVEKFRTAYEVGLLPKVLSGSDEYRKTGWYVGLDNSDKTIARCVYFDAIEMIDQYVNLEDFA